MTRTHHLSSCHRHPTKPITGFCAACLTERLSAIDQDLPIATDLRRSKSCSGAKREGLSALPEPRRSSCDVRAQNTLWDLLHVERSANDKKLELEIGNLGFDLKEEDEYEEEIRVSEALPAAYGDGIDQRVLKADEFDEGIEMKTMKEHIDLEWLSKKNTGRDFRDIAGSFWQAASVFSKKLRKWKGKQKLKGSGGGDDLVAVGVGKPGERRYRGTLSEVGDYGLGRRSCDTDPRMSLYAGFYGHGRRSCDADPRMSLDAAHYGLGRRRSCDADPRMSLDAGRMSCDDMRFSLDEPRASWDGYLIGRAYPRLAPLVSVVEDVKVPLAAGGFEEEALDGVKMKSMTEEHKSPGGSAQTRDYYSPQRRRRSFDRRAAGLEVEELKSISNAKVTLETTRLFHGAKLLITEKELMESNWNQPNGGSHSSESCRSASTDIASVPAVVLGQKGFKKFTGWHKVWHIWGSIQKQRQGESKFEAEDKYLGGNVIDRPLAESLQKLRRVSKGEGNGAISQKLIQSYGVSSRNSYGSVAGLVHNMSSIETKGNVNKRREELVLQRNRSAPYSPTNHDNGLLRFYLTPLRSSRGKSGKSRLKTSHSISRNVL